MWIQHVSTNENHLVGADVCDGEASVSRHPPKPEPNEDRASKGMPYEDLMQASMQALESISIKSNPFGL